MYGQSNDTGLSEISTAWRHCRMNCTFLECYAEESTTVSRPRSMSAPPPSRASAIPSSTAASQQEYVESLVERAEGIAKSAKIGKIADEVQRPRSAPAKLNCEKPSKANKLASPARFGRVEHGLQDKHFSKHAETDVVDYNTYDYNDLHYGESEATTVMLCNIPCRVKLEEIIEAVRSLGFEGTYDLLHAPGPKRRHRHLISKTNIGYAFINFVTPEYASDFMKVFTGFCFEGRQSDKVGMAKLARIQGFLNNYAMTKGHVTPCILPMGVPREAIYPMHSCDADEYF